MLEEREAPGLGSPPGRVGGSSVSPRDNTDLTERNFVGELRFKRFTVFACVWIVLAPDLSWQV